MSERFERAMLDLERLSDRIMVTVRNCCRNEARNWCVIVCGNGPKSRLRESRGRNLKEAIINAARAIRRHPVMGRSSFFKRK